MKRRILAVLLALAAANALAGTPAFAQSAPEARAESAAFTFRPRGRIQYDLQWSDGPQGARRDDYVRRAFIGGEGEFGRRWRYRLDVVLAPDNIALGVNDAFIEYDAGRWSAIVGEFNITSPLEDRTSSLEIPFVERSSAITAFGYGRRLGVGLHASGRAYSLALALQGDSFNADNPIDEQQTRVVSVRATRVLRSGGGDAAATHFGVHVRHREAESGAQFRVRARPLNGRADFSLDTGSIATARFDSDVAIGAEFAAQRGAFGASAEIVALDGEADAGGATFSGGYVDLYWSITGEPRPYHSATGAFRAGSPRVPVGAGGAGHWAASVRYDFLDLSAGSDPNRGEQRSWAVGLDWTPVDRVRFRLNYAESDIDRASGFAGDERVVTFRTQIRL